MMCCLLVCRRQLTLSSSSFPWFTRVQQCSTIHDIVWSIKKTYLSPCERTPKRVPWSFSDGPMIPILDRSAPVS
ncbi:hypothetical protein Hypma_003171 [Hypsizygus marmoreus]|uniref:Uncharacterized protein n=1 Tax=Hypsizygus marmoreus TaxID=39966 RepID=A0A369K2D0_HYPMA|nr:hypothetical protein Hypma_003171 [Hypsizygus marmoreus]